MDSSWERQRITSNYERVLEVAIGKYEDDSTPDSERIQWGRLLVRVLADLSGLVRDDLLEKNREDIENMKTVLRLKGEKL